MNRTGSELIRRYAQRTNKLPMCVQSYSPARAPSCGLQPPTHSLCHSDRAQMGSRRPQALAIADGDDSCGEPNSERCTNCQLAFTTLPFPSSFASAASCSCLREREKREKGAPENGQWEPGCCKVGLATAVRPREKAFFRDVANVEIKMQNFSSRVAMLSTLLPLGIPSSFCHSPSS